MNLQQLVSQNGGKPLKVVNTPKTPPTAPLGSYSSPAGAPNSSVSSSSATTPQPLTIQSLLSQGKTLTPVAPKASPPPLNAADKVIQDVGQAAKDTNSALLSQASPLGWANDAVGFASNLVASGLDKVVDAVAPKIGGALRDAVGANNADAIKAKIKAAAESPIVQNLNKMITSPAVGGDLGAVGDVAQLGGTVAMAGAGAEGMSDLGDNGLSLGKYSTGSIADKANGPTPTPEQVAGKITGAVGPDATTAKTALSTVDTNDVKTFKDLSKVLGDKIKANTTDVDTKLSGSTQTFTPQDLEKRFKFSEAQPMEGGKFGSNYVKANPTADAIDQLSQYYDKTNNPEALAKIKTVQAKFESDGLSPKEMNDLAREHGRMLSGFNANGELASGLNKQSFENTRTGLKNAVRGTMPDEDTKSIDKNTHDLIATKEMVDDMDTKVQKFLNRIKSPSFTDKLRGYGAKVLDFATGGIVSTLLKNTLKPGLEGATELSPLQIQENLSDNLKLLDRLNRAPSTQVAPLIHAMSLVPAAAGAATNAATTQEQSQGLGTND